MTVAADGAGVCVRVTEAGPGIPDTDRDRIFDYCDSPEGAGP
ncbi:hypothetical protein [Streptomyces sp. NPDC001155]